MEKLSVDLSSPHTFHALPATVGMLTFPAGTRLPAEGVSVHAQDEVSFILKGELRATSGGTSWTLKEGDVTLIPAGEEHWADVVSDVTLCYVLLERAEKGTPS